MRRIHAFLAMTIVSLWSCTENEREVFHAEMAALNIWFGNSAVIRDSLVYNYAYRALDADVDSVMFCVRLIGVPTDMDRSFKLRAVGGEIPAIQEGGHYSFGDYLLKAGTIEAEYPLYLKKTDDFRGLPDRSIAFELDESSGFLTGAKEYTRLKLVLKDREEKPENWDAEPFPYFHLGYFFGTYSRVKHQFIITVTGLVVFRVLYQGTPVPPNEISYFEAQYLQRKCRAALAEYNAAHPEDPLKDENGELITFP